MSNIRSGERASFFIKKTRPNSISPSKNKSTKELTSKSLNKLEEKSKLVPKEDAIVELSKPIKEFSKIKSLTYEVPDIDKSERIAALKDKIKNNKYEIDYETLADKLLSQDYR